ncbi:uncharacterized protein LOC123566190 [Mercenaria mercenaria]|uniref:uncharacterized protein LOC123566190 n=1 Tax=Mercenaria mercenaria TaxID=6596 RepID=UPI00234E9628|nr:uncharacterized protein LOC123566190 [Mercenaria mercenaria]
MIFSKRIKTRSCSVMNSILKCGLKAKTVWMLSFCTCLSLLYVGFYFADINVHPSFADFSSLAMLTIKNETFRQNQSLIGATNHIITAKLFEKNTVGILIPSTTRRMKAPAFHKLSLNTLCLPSIYKTIENKYVYKIYIGTDRDDYLYSIKHKIETLFHNVSVYKVSGKTFVKTVNAIARKAYDEGMDYLVRINDDTSFETKNWTSAGLTVLRSYSPPNVGVVGPTCKGGKTTILTHDLVHRTHLDIFGFYYPPYFDNWWADDWITNVYKSERSTKLESWVVKHHQKFHGTRYNVDYKKKHQLKDIVFEGQSQLRKYISAGG